MEVVKDRNYLWTIIKNLKYDLIQRKISYCYEFGFLSIKDIKAIDEKIANILSINVSSTAFDDVSEKTLKTGAEMLFYLYSCPGPNVISWNLFYKEMFENYDPKKIILTLNRILKKSNGHIYNINKKILNKMKETLSLIDRSGKLKELIFYHYYLFRKYG